MSCMKPWLLNIWSISQSIYHLYGIHEWTGCVHWWYDFAWSNPHMDSGVHRGTAKTTHPHTRFDYVHVQHWMFAKSNQHIQCVGKNAPPIIRGTYPMLTGIFPIYHYITNRTIDNHRIVVLHCCSCHFVCIFFCVPRERPNHPNTLNFFHLCTLQSESMLFSTAELNFHFFSVCVLWNCRW